MLERREEFKALGEKLLDEAKRHGNESTAVAAALCAIAWNQLDISAEAKAAAPGQEIDLTDAGPWALHRAVGKQPECDHHPGPMGVCAHCGWNVVTEAWPERGES